MDDSDKDIPMKMYIDKYGNKKYRNSKGEVHRKDGLVIEWTDGYKD